MINLKHIVYTVFILSLVVSSTVQCQSASVKKELVQQDRLPGLYVEKGELMRDGKPYRAIGVNYFSAFYRTLLSVGNKDESYKEGFKILKEQYNIPFIRFMAGGYWPIDWDLYFEDKEKYFKLLDQLVDEADKYEIGLIPSILWYCKGIPDLMGEHMIDFEDPNSRSSKFVKQYVNDIVSRYKNRHVILAWEIGNEYMLQADLPGDNHGMPKIAVCKGTRPFRTPADKPTRKMFNAVFKYAVDEIRKIDPFRMISTGDAVPHQYAWHNIHNGSWDIDTFEQYEEVLAGDTKLVDSISIHVYPHHDRLYFPSKVSVETLIKLSNDIAKKFKKPLFIGEFGAPKTLGPEKEKEIFFKVLNAIEHNKVSLSAIWVFDHSDQDEDWNITPDNSREYMLRAIQKGNERIWQSSQNHP